MIKQFGVIGVACVLAFAAVAQTANAPSAFVGKWQGVTDGGSRFTMHVTQATETSIAGTVSSQLGQSSLKSIASTKDGFYRISYGTASETMTLKLSDDGKLRGDVCVTRCYKATLTKE